MQRTKKNQGNKKKERANRSKWLAWSKLYSFSGDGGGGLRRLSKGGALLSEPLVEPASPRERAN